MIRDNILVTGQIPRKRGGMQQSLIWRLEELDITDHLQLNLIF